MKAGVTSLLAFLVFVDSGSTTNPTTPQKAVYNLPELDTPTTDELKNLLKLKRDGNQLDISIVKDQVAEFYAKKYDSGERWSDLGQLGMEILMNRQNVGDNPNVAKALNTFHSIVGSPEQAKYNGANHTLSITKEALNSQQETEELLYDVGDGKPFAEGAFGKVFKGIDKQGNMVAIKVSTTDKAVEDLKSERNLFELMEKRVMPYVGFPKCQVLGIANHTVESQDPPSLTPNDGGGEPPMPNDSKDVPPTAYALTMELLGLDLQEIFYICGRQFSLKTTLQIILKLLHIFETLHKKVGYIHKDVKPSNILIGRGGLGDSSSTNFYVIDFGVSEEIKVLKDGESEDKGGFVGTFRYMSPFIHDGKVPSPRDDIYSLWIMMMQFVLGSLPWDELNYTNECEFEDQDFFKNLLPTASRVQAAREAGKLKNKVEDTPQAQPAFNKNSEEEYSTVDYHDDGNSDIGSNPSDANEVKAEENSETLDSNSNGAEHSITSNDAKQIQVKESVDKKEVTEGNSAKSPNADNETSKNNNSEKKPGIEDNDLIDNAEQVASIKQNRGTLKVKRRTIDKLCDNEPSIIQPLQMELDVFKDYICTLRVGEIPDYKFLNLLLENLYRRLDQNMNSSIFTEPYDWSRKLNLLLTNSELLEVGLGFGKMEANPEEKTGKLISIFLLSSFYSALYQRIREIRAGLPDLIVNAEATALAEKLLKQDDRYGYGVIERDSVVKVIAKITRKEFSKLYEAFKNVELQEDHLKNPDFCFAGFAYSKIQERKDNSKTEYKVAMVIMEDPLFVAFVKFIKRGDISKAYELMDHAKSCVSSLAEGGDCSAWEEENCFVATFSYVPKKLSKKMQIFDQLSKLPETIKKMLTSREVCGVAYADLRKSSENAETHVAFIVKKFYRAGLEYANYWRPKKPSLQIRMDLSRPSRSGDVQSEKNGRTLEEAAMGAIMALGIDKLKNKDYCYIRLKCKKEKKFGKYEVLASLDKCVDCNFKHLRKEFLNLMDSPAALVNEVNQLAGNVLIDEEITLKVAMSNATIQTFTFDLKYNRKHHNSVSLNIQEEYMNYVMQAMNTDVQYMTLGFGIKRCGTVKMIMRIQFTFTKATEYINNERKKQRLEPFQIVLEHAKLQATYGWKDIPKKHQNLNLAKPILFKTKVPPGTQIVETYGIYGVHSARTEEETLEETFIEFAKKIYSHNLKIPEKLSHIGFVYIPDAAVERRVLVLLFKYKQENMFTQVFKGGANLISKLIGK